MKSAVTKNRISTRTGDTTSNRGGLFARVSPVAISAKLVRGRDFYSRFAR